MLLFEVQRLPQVFFILKLDPPTILRNDYAKKIAGGMSWSCASCDCSRELPSECVGAIWWFSTILLLGQRISTKVWGRCARPNSHRILSQIDAVRILTRKGAFTELFCISAPKFIIKLLFWQQNEKGKLRPLPNCCRNIWHIGCYDANLVIFKRS